MRNMTAGLDWRLCPCWRGPLKSSKYKDEHLSWRVTPLGPSSPFGSVS
jgi:hypothetical protein